MNPVDLIAADLGPELSEQWKQCSPDIKPIDELSPFAISNTYRIYGATRQFDFPCLPHGSYGLYDANGRRAIRLTIAGKEIEQVLKENWEHLPKCDAVKLASLVLKFYDGGIRSAHRVLKDRLTLLNDGRNYVLNQREVDRISANIGETAVELASGEIHLRAVTLCGWMHAKQNLGIEHLRIDENGKVRLDKRVVLTKKTFLSVPGIRY
jgi:hypothetical protein